MFPWETQATGGSPHGHEYNCTELLLIICKISTEKHLQALSLSLGRKQHVTLSLSFVSLSQVTAYVSCSVRSCATDPEGQTCPYTFFDIFDHAWEDLHSSSFLFHLYPSFFTLSVCLGVVYSEVRRPCRVMILVNPHSGRGQALQLFTGHVQGMLTEAAVPYTLVITG